jgi:hypothetical protein
MNNGVEVVSMFIKVLFASLEGKEREGKAKREETSGKISKFGREGVWRVNFSS